MCHFHINILDEHRQNLLYPLSAAPRKRLREKQGTADTDSGACQYQLRVDNLTRVHVLFIDQLILKVNYMYMYIMVNVIHKCISYSALSLPVYHGYRYTCYDAAHVINYVYKNYSKKSVSSSVNIVHKTRRMQNGLLLQPHCCIAAGSHLVRCLYWKRQVHQSFV